MTTIYNYSLILKGMNKEFAKIEFQELWSLYFNEKIKLKQTENTLFQFSSKFLIKSTHKLLERLTFTNFISLNIYKFKTIEELKQNISSLDLNKYDGKYFRVRVKKSKRTHKAKFTEKLLAGVIWDNFKKPKVSIDKPDVEFNFIFQENSDDIFMGIKIFENDKDYLTRMPKLRPIKMPYTLKSDMARAAINMLKLKEGIILDPFCGIGGILLEATDMGFEIIGNDISWNDLKYFKKNFDHYYPKTSYIRILADSKTQFLKENTVDAIVTDIPYGKCSRKLGTDLYEKFLQSAKQYLKPNKRLVIIYANFTQFKPLALKYFDEVVEIEEYINKSMTRHILVLENRRE